MTYHARCAHKDNESGIQTAPTFEWLASMLGGKGKGRTGGDVQNYTSFTLENELDKMMGHQPRETNLDPINT